MSVLPFVGAIDSDAVPVPDYAVTTSLSCDGNLNTFRYLEKKKGVPFTFLDVPYGDDGASVEYLAEQLREFAHELEERFAVRFDEEKLKESLRIENETRKELVEFFRLQSEHYYPGELISHLYMMMGMHLLIGTQEFLDLIRFMNEDIQTYPKFEGKKILWVHLLPFYQESLQKCFNTNQNYQIIASDIMLDSAEKLDPERPFHSLARKIIHNILDGDGIDKRNSHDGQIKTRLEAFLEMLDVEEET